MSGHNKWSTIKHKKGAADAKRGKLFTKLIKEITVSAKIGGGNADGNPRLRSAITAARAANMPSDNIDRAIKRGTGELEGVTYEENTYEGYGPGGAAVLVQTLTDNKNRTVAELRHLFSKYNGNLGESGCVAWMFNRVGQILVDKTVSEEEMMERALDAGAEDVLEEDDYFELRCTPTSVDDVAEKLRQTGTEIVSAQVAMTPQNTVKVSGRDAEVILKLVDALEDHDDVQHVWSNFDIDNDVIERAMKG